ncbi:MAG: hypothetical protein P8170_14520 [Gemmatimonadota bacterium]
MDPRARSRRGWWDALALVAVGVAMAAWTWGAWADILVDFGRELYVPWRIAVGETLYGDVAYFNGPLSPHVNALWFWLFGTGLWTLLGVNLVLVGLLTALTYHVHRVAGGRAPALFASTTFLLVFAFGQRLLYANYNFVAPYSHEVTHGLFLLMLGIVCVERHATRGGHIGWAAAAGACVGSALLTKPEIAVASLSIPTGLAFAAAHRRQEGEGGPGRRSSRAQVVAAFAGGLALPPAVALLFLGVRLPLSTAWNGLTGAWGMAFDPDITSLPFYRAVLGLDAPGRRMTDLARALVGVGLIAVPAMAVVARMDPRRPSNHHRWMPFIVAALFIGGVVTTLVVTVADRPFHLARSIPAVLGILLAWTVLGALGRAQERMEARRAVTRFTLLVLSLLLCSKMILATRVDHYGFALAMLGTVTIVAAVVGWIPEAVGRSGRDSRPLRAWVLGALLVLAGSHLMVVGARTGQKRVRVGVGKEIIRTDTIRGPVVEQALAFLSARSTPGFTVLVLPEGATLNFLLRAPSPTPFINFMPPEIIHFGEARMLQALETHPPDVVLLVHKDPTEYGTGRFGEGYGGGLLSWVLSNYESVASWGDPPFRNGSEFGIQALVRTP